MEENKKTQRVYIRFNTEYPAKGKRWRLLDEHFKEFEQVDGFVGFECPIMSSTDTLPTGETKHHVMVLFSSMAMVEGVAEFHR